MMDTTKEKTRNDVNITEHSIPLGILHDLSSRFVINIPGEERNDLVRVCFQIELAHWFYLDFYCSADSGYKLNPCGMKEFTAHMFQLIPFLKPHFDSVDRVLEQWREYKQAVPTYGAVILDRGLTHVLLVQSYWARSSWGFPKGKVNYNEEPTRCAAREVLEETGFDVSGLIDPADYIESTINDQVNRLYMVSGVDRAETTFAPRTRNEIRAVEWFALADLPNSRKDLTPKVKMRIGANSFFMVMPFIKRMKRWVSERQNKLVSSPGGTLAIRRHRHKSAGDAETVSSVANGNNTHPPTNGNKKQQQFALTIQSGMADFQQLQKESSSQVGAKVRGSGAGCSPQRNGGRRGVEERARGRGKEKVQSGASGYKRKLLFINSGHEMERTRTTRTITNSRHNATAAIIGNTASTASTPATATDALVFCAPSWLNFKFDRQAILRVLTH